MAGMAGMAVILVVIAAIQKRVTVNPTNQESLLNQARKKANPASRINPTNLESTGNPTNLESTGNLANRANPTNGSGSISDCVLWRGVYKE
jgi:hypothetical protein